MDNQYVTLSTQSQCINASHHGTVNISVCVFPIQAMPDFFRYGYAMPLYSISIAMLSVIFGTKNTSEWIFIISVVSSDNLLFFFASWNVLWNYYCLDSSFMQYPPSHPVVRTLEITSTTVSGKQAGFARNEVKYCLSVHSLTVGPICLFGHL